MGKVSRLANLFFVVGVLLAIAAVSVHSISFTFFADVPVSQNRTVAANCTVFPWSQTIGGCNPAAPASGLVNCAVLNVSTIFGVNRTAVDANNRCALPASANISTVVRVIPNGRNFTGTASGKTQFPAFTLYNYGKPDVPNYEEFTYFWFDSAIQDCPTEYDATPGMFYDNTTGKGKVLMTIGTPHRCNLEYLVPYVRRGGGAGIIMCEPTMSAVACGYTHYNFQQYGDKSYYKFGVFVLNACGALPICGQAKGQIYNASGYYFNRPARVRVWADVNNWLVPTNFWFEGPYFAFVRVCLPIYGFFLAIWAAQRLYMFIRQQGGVKFNSLAQWSMFLEMIANVCRATKFTTFSLYINLAGNYGLLATSEGLVMCNMILAAVFWGTLDVNSSPLYKYRYLCGLLCVVFVSVTIGIAVEAVRDPAAFAPIFTHWVFYNECAIGCAVFMFVPRRLYQLSKYQLMQQEMETKPAEAGEDAVKAAEEQADEEDDEEAAVAQQSAEANAVGVAGSTNTTTAPTGVKPMGHKRRPPIVMKMLYWSCLISVYCIVSIAQLICVTTYDQIPQFDRYEQENWFFYQRSIGICGMIMSTTQMLMYTPKKVRRPGQGSTAGSMTNPRTNASTA